MSYWMTEYMRTTPRSKFEKILSGIEDENLKEALSNTWDEIHGTIDLGVVLDETDVGNSLIAVMKNKRMVSDDFDVSREDLGAIFLGILRGDSPDKFHEIATAVVNMFQNNDAVQSIIYQNAGEMLSEIVVQDPECVKVLETTLRMMSKDAPSR